jgi:hypothetical protein
MKINIVLIGLCYFILSLTPLNAHREEEDNGKILSWDKLQMELSFDTEKKEIRVKGHSHHPDGTEIILILKFVQERYSLDRVTVRVKEKAFYHVFGPFNDKNFIPGDYEVSCWFIMEQQPKLLQRQLLQSNFFHCSPPCPFDFQHYQTEIVSVGTPEEIEEELAQNKKKIAEAFKRLKNPGEQILERCRLAQKQIVEAEESLTPEALEEALKKFYYDLEDLYYETREVVQELSDYREKQAYILFSGVYEYLVNLSSLAEILKNTARRAHGSKKVKNISKLENVCKTFEEQLKAIPEMISTNFIESREETSERQKEEQAKHK